MLITRLRTAVAMVAIGVATIGLASPALAADPVQGQIGTVSHAGDYDNRYFNGSIGDDKPADLPVGINGITIPVKGGEQKLVYCIDIRTALNASKHPIYNEADWSSISKNISQADLLKINWILHNSYPTKSAAAVREAAKAGEPAKSLAIPHDEYIVYAATQAAIWHYSDKFKLLSTAVGHEDRRFNPDEFAQIKKIYDYLLGEAVKAPVALGITISPASADGKVGDKVGPYTVTSTVGEVTLSATGGKILDADGKVITKTANGGKFWLTGDTAGQVKATAAGSGNLELARVFVNSQGADLTQKVILPGDKKVDVKAEAVANLTATPTLPVTGAAAAGIAGAGVLLLGVGGGLVLMRRRRINFQA
ncbi:thioester domain-containing protein [Longispora sp. NPDC051575]|uniref:thioester domain-containing protein n=1 Tax=Longispora sp. NPDC051575 TaxID=3154943 RepID=UPI00341ECFA2